MSGIKIVSSKKFLEETNPVDHPEKPLRIEMFMEDYGDEAIEVESAEEDYLYGLHDPSYVNYVKTLSETVGEGEVKKIEYQTPVTESTYEIAKQGIGTARRVSQEMINQPGEPVLGVIRPPGHHANKSYSSGFCIFNNLASAKKDLEMEGLDKIFIADFDAHYGDGIEDFVTSNDQSIYFSIDEDWFTESRSGYVDVSEDNLHLSLPPKSGQRYSEIFDLSLEKIFENYSPEAFLCAAGFDGHFSDSLSQLKLSQNDYYDIGKSIEKNSKDMPLGFILEGGYNEAQVYRGLNNLLVNWDENFSRYHDPERERDFHEKDKYEDIVDRVEELENEFYRELDKQFN